MPKTDLSSSYTPRAALGCISNFSFLTGASHPQEMTSEAARLGWQSIGLGDRGNCAGLVRAHAGAEAADIHLVLSVQLCLQDALSADRQMPELICMIGDKAGYESICRLLSSLNREQRPQGGRPSYAQIGELARLKGQLELVIVPPADPNPDFFAICQQILPVLQLPIHMGGIVLRDGCDAARLAQLSEMAKALNIDFIALAGALYHRADRRPLADVVHCIREGITLSEAGLSLSRNAERHLLSPAEMARRWQGYEFALKAADRLADRCRFSMSELRYEYPDEITSRGRTAIEELVFQSWQGAAERYPDGVPDTVKAYLDKELALIEKLKYAPYFLTVFDIVRFARSRNILCQGRGSAANSAVCYCLGITAVDPERSEPLFERFVSESRNEPPDIDVDFEHERREEIIQYIYHKYGHHRAGLTAAVITYRSRSALVEIAKVFGLSRDVQQALSGQVWGREKGKFDAEMLVAAGLEPGDPTLQLILKLVQQLQGFPRHLSQHVGGFVIARDRLDHLCAIRPAAMDGRTIIEWDKDDLDILGLLKVDVLALGMLSCLRRAFMLMEQHYYQKITLASVPPEDSMTYDMLCRGQSVGVFQVESRAQMAMLPRLQPRCFHDLVVQVAIVRPGPIQGDMVHPYLRRRAGLERTIYPSEELRSVLEKTLGVPLFQEQAMKIAIVGAGFTGAEADQLRRAMATFRKNGLIHDFHDRMIRGMVERGYDEAFAIRCFKQIEGFGTYGFPESHAASFALLVYVSSWIKCHYPDVFICALLNAQPMGFYGPAQLVAEAKRSGVEVRPVDVSASFWDCTLEPTSHGRHALRLGFRQVRGVRQAEVSRIAASRNSGYANLNEIIRRADVSVQTLEALAKADAFRSLGLNARQAFWDIKRLGRIMGQHHHVNANQKKSGHQKSGHQKPGHQKPGNHAAANRTKTLPLFAHAEQRYQSIMPDEVPTQLPIAPLGEQVAQDYQATSLSLKAHPMTLLKPYFTKDGWVSCGAALSAQTGRRLRLIGLVVGRQRPGTAHGTVFVTLEDEAGPLNVIVWPKLVETQRADLLGAHILAVVGRVQKEGSVLHFIAESLHNGDKYLQYMQTATHEPPRLKSRDFH